MDFIVFVTMVTMLLPDMGTSQGTTTIFECNFDSNFCGFESDTYIHTTTNLVADSWQRQQGTTPSGVAPDRYTGPPGAHGGTHYGYFEASFRPSNDLSGTLTSNIINYQSGTNYVMRLYFFDHGTSLGPLELNILGVNGAVLSTHIIDDGKNPSPTNWELATISFDNPQQNFRIQFKASTTGNFDADWAIDTITVTYSQITNACQSVTCPGVSVCSNTGNTYVCTCPAGYTQTGNRMSTVCHVNGGLSDWFASTPCSQTCGGGTLTESRTCTNPAPAPLGAGCDPELSTSRTATCNTQDCPVACTVSKPCDCKDKIPQFITGQEPDMSLSYFAGISPGDLQAAMNLLNNWSKEKVASMCMVARCDSSQLMSMQNSLSSSVATLVEYDSGLVSAIASMKDILDCNENEMIELNLWAVYDFLIERRFAINQVKTDLMSKKKIIDAEMARCENRPWMTSMFETWRKVF